MKTVYLPDEMIHFTGCRDSSQYYNRACESSQIQAIRQVSDKAQFNKSLAVATWLEVKTERSNDQPNLLFAVYSHVKWHPGAQEKNKDHGNVCFIFGFMLKGGCVSFGCIYACILFCQGAFFGPLSVNRAEEIVPIKDSSFNNKERKIRKQTWTQANCDGK